MTATTTRRPRNPRRYYALHWPCGYGAKYAYGSAADCVTVYGFDSAADRDAACLEYRAPNHSPTARLEPALASHPSVSRAVRGTRFLGHSYPTSDVREWGDEMKALVPATEEEEEE